MGVVFSLDGGAEEWLGMFPYYNRKTPGLAPTSILYMQVKFFQVLQREKGALIVRIIQHTSSVSEPERRKRI
jgi:hypothetical protein